MYNFSVDAFQQFYKCALIHLFLAIYIFYPIDCMTQTIYTNRFIGKTLTNHTLQTIHLTADYNILFSSSLDGYITIVDVKDKEQPQILKEHFIYNTIISFTLLASDQKLVTTHTDRLFLFEISSQYELKKVATYMSTNPMYVYQFLKASSNNQFLIVILNGGFQAINIINFSSPQFMADSPYVDSEDWDVTISQDDRFVFKASSDIGLIIYDFQSKTSFILAASINLPSTSILLHPNQNYMFFNQVGQGLWCYSFAQLYTDSFPVTFNGVMSQIAIGGGQNNGISMSLIDEILVYPISPDGLAVIDVRDKSNLLFVQLIHQVNSGLNIKIQKNSQYFYFVNSQSVFIYKRITPNLNDEIPTLVHYYQSQIIEKVAGTPFDIGSHVEKSSSSNSNLLFVANMEGGFDIVNSVSLAKISHVDASLQENKVYRVIQSTVNSNYIFVLCDYGFSIYNIAVPTNPQFVKYTPSIGTYQCTQLKELRGTFSGYAIISLMWGGLQTVNLANMNNPVNVKSVDVGVGAHSDFDIRNDESYLYVAQFNSQLSVYSLADINDIKVVARIVKETVVAVKLSQDNKLLFTAESNGSFVIYNVSNPTLLLEINRIELDGWIMGFCMTSKQDYAFIAMSYGAAAFQKINLVNVKKLFLSEMYSQDSYASACMVDNQDKQIFLQTPSGLRTIPMGRMSIDEAVQTNYYWQKTNTVLPINTQFFVGQNIEIDIIPIFQPTKKKINSVQVISHSELQQNPEIVWGKRRQTCQVKMQLQKDNIGENLLLIHSAKVIENLASEAGITGPEEQVVLSTLKKLNLIDTKNYPKINLYDDLELLDENLPPALAGQPAKRIKDTLKQKIYLFPSYFYVESSLRETENGLVETLTDTLNIEIRISDAQWFKLLIDGIQISYTDNQTTLMIYGLTNIVNEALTQIKLTNYTVAEKINVQRIIKDGVNSDLVKEGTLLDFPFIKMNHAVKFQKSIQDQFENQYSNSKITVEKQNLFEFSKETFIDEDVLTYEAFIVEQQVNAFGQTEDVLKAIPQQFWVTFISEERRFSFKPDYYQLSDEINLVVRASDGYTQAISDKFTVRPRLLPVEYILTIIGSSFGSLVSFIAMLKYRVYFYRALCKKKFTYPKVVVQVGEEYNSAFPLLYSNKKEAEYIIKELKRMQKKRNQDFLLTYYNNKQGVLNEKLLMDDISQARQEIQKRSQVSQYKTCLVKTIMRIINYIVKFIYQDQQHSKSAAIEQIVENQHTDQIIRYRIFKMALDSNKWLHFFFMKNLESRALEKSPNNNQKNWYKHYFTIDSTTISDKKFLPELILNENFLEDFDYCYEKKFPTPKKKAIDKKKTIDIVPELEQIQPPTKPTAKEIQQLQQEGKLHENEYLKKYEKIKFNLILEIVKGEAWGLCTKDLLEYSRGESIIQDAVQIGKAMAMQMDTRHNIFVLFLMKLIHYEYEEMQTPFPDWLSCETLYKNVLYFKGKPENKDVNHTYLIRIQDKDELVLKEFLLEVVNPIKEESENEPDIEAIKQVGQKVNDDVQQLISGNVDMNQILSN